VGRPWVVAVAVVVLVVGVVAVSVVVLVVGVAAVAVVETLQRCHRELACKGHTRLARQSQPRTEGRRGCLETSQGRKPKRF
jgi:hypothetical protein